MPSGPKKRRAHKKKNEAAAAREKTENEAPLTAIWKENSPVMKTESTDGVTAVFDEPTVVLPKRTVLLESMLGSEVLEIKRKDSEEGNKENAPLAQVYSDVQPLNVAEPLEKIPEGKINVVADSSAVVAPYVILLDSEDEDGDSMMFPDVCYLEGKDTEGTIENPLPNENCSSVLVSNPPVISPTTKLCDLDLVADECSNAEDAFFTELYTSEEQRILEHNEDNAIKKNQDLVTSRNRVAVENTETATPNEVVAPKKSEAVQVNKVEATMMNQEAAVSEYVNDVEKKTLEAVVEVQETAAVLEYVNDIEKNSLEAVVENQVTATVSEYVNDIEKNTFEAVLEIQETASVSEKFETKPNNLEAVVAAKLAVDIIYQTRDAVSTELVRPEVKKQLKEIKEMVEDVLNRINTIDALLDMN